MSSDSTQIPRPEEAPEAPALQGDALQAMFDRVRADTIDETEGVLDPIRSLPSSARVVVVVSVQLMVLSMAVGLQTVRQDILLLAVPLVVLYGVAVAAVAFSLMPMGRASRVASRVWPWAVVLPMLISLPAVWPGVSMGFWEAMPTHISCSWRTVLVAGLCTLPWVIVERHGLTRRWSTLAAAGSAGLAAFIAQVATCPLATLEHRVVAHGASGLVIAAILLVAAWVSHRKD